MPRNPGARKHQHNNRHENGLVGPGKRVTKQKSNGHLNGSAKGSLPSQPLPTSTSQASTVNGEGNGSGTADSRGDEATRLAAPALNTRDSESSYDGGVQENAKKWESTNGTAMPVQRRSEAKSKPSQDVSTLQIASTILKSRPAADTIALLIVLLSLPSMLLTVVQILFAALTVMPGAGITPFASFWSLFDLFQGSAGVPSLGVMAWVDVVCFVTWIFLWNWAQNFALDLAQIHIAITLGNGSQGKSGNANTLCTIIVLMLHTIRSRGVRRFLLQNFVPTNLLSETRLADYIQYLPKDIELGDTPSAPSWLRSLFAIHIISQALISLVRKSVAGTQTTVTSKASKRNETESSNATADVSASEGAGGAAVSSGIEYQHPPTPGLRDGKEKAISAKKRRRQANHVRSKQPFWAALASTKVHVLREVENNKGLPTVANNPSGPFDNSQDQVWVTDVDPSSIQFEATFTKPDQDDQESMLPEGSRPFYITINEARWQSVTIDHMESNSTEGPQAQWFGEVSGLAPNCPYTCTFIRADDNQEFASVMVKTPALEDGDLQTTHSPAPIRQSARPSSPTTTLKNSISAANDKLSDARKRLAQLKRQHKMSVNKVDREVDSMNGRLKSGGDDNKLRQKLLQTERNMRQTEDSTNNIMEALETLETVPEDETIEHASRKKSYETQKSKLIEANETLSKVKGEADSELSCINGELSTIAGRKERLVARQTKLGEQHDRITQANVQGLNEKERREADSMARESEYRRREAEMQNVISGLEQDIRRAHTESQELWQRIDFMEKQDIAQRQKMMHAGGPLTPEGELPGTRPAPQHARPFAFGSFNAVPTTLSQEPQSSPFLAYANTLADGARRPRSDTNRSLGATSNFSDFDDADPIPPMPSNIEFDANGRKGSGSSRGKNNGSPATGVMGGGLKSPTRGTNSPGHLQGQTSW